MLNFVEKRRSYFIITAILILLSVVLLVVSTSLYGSPLRISIDFSGGSLFVLQFEEPITEDAIRDVFLAQGYTGAIIQKLGTAEDNLWQARTSKAAADEVEAVFDALTARGAKVDRERSSVDIVAPTVGAEVASNAAVAVLTASLAVLIFIWFSFRGIPHSIRYGVASIIAMVVNVIVAIGFYALMGILQGWEANALFLTALLTVIGFSVQDIIVVFDRVRENISRHHGEPFAQIVNRSVMETIHRSLATQLNAMFIMISILLFGGATIKPFIAVMLVGMVSETFTSLFVAAPILVVWDEYSSHRQQAFG